MTTTVHTQNLRNPSTFKATVPFWRYVKDSVDIRTILRTMGFEESQERFKRGVWRVPHDGCIGVHSDGKPSTFLGDSGRIHCRKCGESLGHLEVVAAGLGVSLPPSGAWSLDDPTIKIIWDECAIRGWCSPRETPRSRVKKPSKLVARVPREVPRCPSRKSPPKKVQARWTQRRLEEEFEHLRSEAAQWHRSFERWCLERGWSRDIAELLSQAPPFGVAWAQTRSPEKASGLLKYANGIHRPLLMGLYDAEGKIRSASRRLVGQRRKGDELPKSLALSSKVVGSGFSCRSFGSITEAVKAHTASEWRRPILLCEGGPDYVLASAMVKAGHASAALGGESAGSLPKIGAALAAELKRQKVEGAEVWIIPDLKRTKDEGGIGGIGLEKMREAGRKLVGLASVWEVLLPIPAQSDEVDLSDIGASSEDLEDLWMMVKLHTKILHERFLDLHYPNAKGYLPPLSFSPGKILGVRASLGSGKTERAAQLIDSIQMSPHDGEIIAINHRRSLSEQLSARLGLINYETFPKRRIDESVAICLNSLGRLSDGLVRGLKLVIIDEVEAVMAHLFGETLSKPPSPGQNRPTTGPVSRRLGEILRAVIRNKGMILCLDAHLTSQTLENLRSFAELKAPVEELTHITPLEAVKVSVLPSPTKGIEGALKLLEEGKRPIIATDSRRLGQNISAYLTSKNWRVKFYSSEMGQERRDELGDVERAWSRAECDVVIYTPSIDAGISFDPQNLQERFDAAFGLFTGGASLPATALQQMMFRARWVNDHQIYIANRDNPASALEDDIGCELLERTHSSRSRLKEVNKPVPHLSRDYWELGTLEVRTERQSRLRTQHLKAQTLSMYTTRGAEVAEVEDIKPSKKKEISNELRQAANLAALARAARIEKGVLYTSQEYETALRKQRKSQDEKDALELSRLVRQFGQESVDRDLIMKDERRRITRGVQNAVSLRLALEGRWRVLTELDRLTLADGYPSKVKRPDLPVLSTIIKELLPEEFWLKACAPSPAEIKEGLPDLVWSSAHFTQSGVHLKAATLLDELAQMRGVRPDALLEGLKTNREELNAARTAVRFVGAVLHWIGLGTKGKKVRLSKELCEAQNLEITTADWKKYTRLYRIDEERWRRRSKLSFVESARQRGLDVDPLDPASGAWSEILNEEEGWRSPFSSLGRYEFSKAQGSWNVTFLPNDLLPGTRMEVGLKQSWGLGEEPPPPQVEVLRSK